MYSLKEVLALFDLTYDITLDDLKRAKKTVLRTHPDKSGLKSEYFLFFKKAFDIVVHFYEQQQKEKQEVPKEEQKYVPINTSGLNTSSSSKITKTINEMSSKEFQKKFNQLFEENMAKRPDDAKNAWFKDEKPMFSDDLINNIPKESKQNLNEIYRVIKEDHSSKVLTQYRGVENLYSGGGGTNSGSVLYDELEDENQYVSCDPFSKLKFDDLRKVHKDQTIMAVSEDDYRKMPKYSSVDHLMQARGSEPLNPLEKAEAERILESQQRAHREKIMQLEHRSGLQTMEYKEKNKTILANFLRLT